ncbi:SCP2 sterol-binding domain-containing protein [Rhodococcus pyridinivorans]|uniref:SCP2 sterol-binding domain-containing protein n=1 Tax=Rhodococcus pyridinivorans TaxID=103816 RepID=UPI0039B3D02C
MPSFTDEKDLFTYVGGIFEKAYQDPDLGPKLSSTGAVLLVQCTDPDSEVVLDMPNKKVYPSVADCPVPPNATMRMSTDTANRFWQGKVNMTLAMAKGQVKTEGAIMKVLKLVPSTKFLFPIYIDDLKAAGRDDLLV